VFKRSITDEIQGEQRVKQYEALKKNRVPCYLPYVICILASMFYLYEFVLQVSPSVMTSQLMQDFGVGAAGVSVISAFYYYSYTPMQLVAGLLYDRFGPRRVLTAAVLVCASGAFFFCTTQSVEMASTGRFLMGVGSAFSFIGALMLISRWFPPYYFALIAGVVQSMSAIGAICGQIPIAAAVEDFGWRGTLKWIAFFGVVLAILISLIVRDNPPGVVLKSPKNKTGEMGRLRIVLEKPQTWFSGIYAFASWGPIVLFAALWGIPYLVEKYQVSTTQASVACAMIWLGVGIGSPLFGWLSDLFQNRRGPLILCSVLTVVSGVLVLYAPISYSMMYVVLFLFGLAGSGQSLSFAVVKDNNSNHVTGTAIGFNNLVLVLSGAVLQPFAGIILHKHWHGAYEHGVPLYHIGDYVAAMSLIPFCGILGLIMSIFFIKETHCRRCVKERD
jgi:MFS family permease